MNTPTTTAAAERHDRKGPTMTDHDATAMTDAIAIAEYTAERSHSARRMATTAAAEAAMYRRHAANAAERMTNAADAATAIAAARTMTAANADAAEYAARAERYIATAAEYADQYTAMTAAIDAARIAAR